MISKLFRGRANARLIDRLHGEIVAAARNPAFYETLGIADTFEGRFEMLTVHASVTLRRLNQLAAPGPDIAQDLVDAVFANLDAALREVGIGDLAVPKRIKKLAEAFFGRAAAYDAALQAGDQAGLTAAVRRNVFGGADGTAAPRLAAYVRQAADRLAGASLEEVTAAIPFPDPQRV